MSSVLSSTCFGYWYIRGQNALWTWPQIVHVAVQVTGLVHVAGRADGVSVNVVDIVLVEDLGPTTVENVSKPRRVG